MNITADPGLLYNMSELFTVRCLFIKKMNYNKSILNITKQNPFYLAQKPLYFEPKYKR